MQTKIENKMQSAPETKKVLKVYNFPGYPYPIHAESLEEAEQKLSELINIKNK